jgi:hypothetical protein
LAKRYFEQARELSDRDGGRTWGVPLYGPMLFVEPQTRAVIANEADAKGILKAEDGVFCGTLPASVGVANTATRLGGTHWTMVMWPLPANKQDRGQLMLHELFHRVQEQVGLPASSPDCGHLDSEQGRALLRLEWRALIAALRSEGEARRGAIADALLFRAQRHELFADGAHAERALERNEGLAEYTGMRLACEDAKQMAERAAAALEWREKMDSLARGFAYGSGPAYGALLDVADVDWRAHIATKPGSGAAPVSPTPDLGQLLCSMSGLGSAKVGMAEVESRAARYDGAALFAAERERAVARAARLAELRKRFFDGPVLRLPLGDKISYTFNPNAVESYDDTASYYHTLEVSDHWGILKAGDGALLIRKDGRVVEVRVTAPSADGTSGPGWTLQLTPGWRVTGGPGADRTLTPP